MRQFASERFGITLSRSSCLNWLHRLGFSFKRPKKRLLKAKESLREAFVAEYGALMEEAQRTGAKVFFADEAHFRADPELRGKWVLKGEPALVDSTSPSYGEKASYYSAVCLETAEVERMDASSGSAGGQQQQQQRNVGSLPGTVAGEARRAAECDLGQCAGASGRGGERTAEKAGAEPEIDKSAGIQPRLQRR